MPEKEEKENKEKIDIKGTISEFLKPDEPEMSQEEAIMKYTEKKSATDNDEDMSEEQEHLERVKKELLASLERVKMLEKIIFSDKDVQQREKLKVEKASSSSSGWSMQRAKEVDEKIKAEQKER